MADVLPPPTLDRIAVFLSFPTESLTTLLAPAPETQVRDLVVQLLQKIDERARDDDTETSLRHEVEGLRSQLKAGEVDLENTTHTSQKRIRTLESQLVNARSSEEQARSEIIRHETEYRQLTIQFQSLQQTHATCEIQLQTLQNRIQTLEESNRESLSLIDRKQQDLDSAQEEISIMAGKLAEAKKDISRLDSELQDAKTAETSAKFHQQTAEQEKELLRQQVEWFNGELSTKSDEFAKYRRDKSTETAQFQADLDAVQQQLSSLQTTHIFTQRRLQETTIKLEESMEKCKEYNDRIIVQEEGFKIEMSTQQRLATLWERQAKEAKERLDELESNTESIKREAVQNEINLREELDNAAQEKLMLQNALDKANDMISQLRVELKGANEYYSDSILSAAASVNGKGKTPLRSSSQTLTPTAHLAASFQKSGKTLTEVYADNVALLDENSRYKREITRLNECLAQILADIEERAPLLQEQRKEYERIVLEADQMSKLLGVAMVEKDTAVAKEKEHKLLLERVEREKNALEQDVRDLARQVRALVIEVETLNGREVISDDISTDESETDHMISTKLISFRNVTELQEKNQRLVRVTRQLASQLESEEEKNRARAEDIESAAVAQAHELIKQLRDENRNINLRLEAVSKEKDMWQRMLGSRADQLNGNLLSSSAGSAQQGLGQSMQTGQRDESVIEEYKRLANDERTQFEAFRRETAKDSKILREQLETAQQQASDYRIQLAKAQSQVNLTQERFNMLRQREEDLGRELDELRKRNNALHGTSTKQELANGQMIEELLEIKAKEEKLRNEVSNLRAEKNIHQSQEKRLLDQLNVLEKDRAALQELLKNIQSMQNEAERAIIGEKKRLEQRVEVLERELASSRAELGKEMDLSRAEKIKREGDISGFQARIDKLTVESQQTRESLLVAQNNLSHAESRVQELTAQLNAASEKLNVYERRPSTSGANSTLTTEQQLQAETAELRTQLADSKAELQSEHMHHMQYKAIAKANEEALAQMITSSDEYHAKMDALIQERDKEITSLKQQMTELQTEFAKAVAETQELQDKLREDQAAWEKERNRQEERIAELSTVEDRANQARVQMEEDVRINVKIAQDAQHKYEHELMLHSTDVQALTKLKEEHGHVLSEVNGYKQQAELAIANLQASEMSWESQRVALESGITNLETRCQDLITQNNILHSQLDQLSTQALRIQQQANTPFTVAQDDGSEAAASNNKSIEELREVIRFLRRENEILTAQHELNLQESKRFKQQLEHTSRSLDEARATLTEERRRASESTQSAEQHADLLAKINQLNILRESNTTLRDENERNARRVRELEVKLKEVESKLEPYNEQVRNLQAELESREQEVKTLEEDNKRWRNRTQQILQKYERIDPVELENLKKEVAQLKEDLQTLQKEKDEALKTATEESNKFKELSEKHTKMVNTARALKVRNDSWKVELDKRAAEIEQLKKGSADATAVQDEMQKLQEQKLQEHNELQAEINTLKENITKLKNDLEQTEQKGKRMNMAALQWKRKSDGFEQEKKSLEAKITELEAKTVDSANTGTNGITQTEVEAIVNQRLAETVEKHTQEKQTAIDEAVKARETELTAAHQTALEELQTQLQLQLESKYKVRISMAEGKAKKLTALNEELQQKLKSLNPTAPVLSPTPGANSPTKALNPGAASFRPPAIARQVAPNAKQNAAANLQTLAVANAKPAAGRMQARPVAARPQTKTTAITTDAPQQSQTPSPNLAPQVQPNPLANKPEPAAALPEPEQLPTQTVTTSASEPDPVTTVPSANPVDNTTNVPSQGRPTAPVTLKRRRPVGATPTAFTQAQGDQLSNAPPSVLLKRNKAPEPSTAEVITPNEPVQAANESMPTMNSPSDNDDPPLMSLATTVTEEVETPQVIEPGEVDTEQPVVEEVLESHKRRRDEEQDEQNVPVEIEVTPVILGDISQEPGQPRVQLQRNDEEYTVEEADDGEGGEPPSKRQKSAEEEYVAVTPTPVTPTPVFEGDETYEDGA